MFKVILSVMLVLGLMAISSVLIKAPTPVKVKKTNKNNDTLANIVYKFQK